MTGSCSKKILCLHGFYQTSTIFSHKTATLFKKLEKLGYEIDLMDGPIKLKPCDLPFEVSPPQPEEKGISCEESEFVMIPNKDQFEIARGWYVITRGLEDEPYLDPQTHHSLHPNNHCCKECPARDKCSIPTPPRQFNAEIAITEVRQHIKEHGPYVGIIGFSQGGCVLNMLLCAGDEELNVNWAITCSSNVPGTSHVADSSGTDAAMRFKKINRHIPVLIMCGDKDTHILKAATTVFKDKWSPKAQLLIHDGGHCMPQKSGYIQKIIDFIQKSAPKVFH